VDRLSALSARDLAEELMPAFGPDGPTTPGWGHIVNWLRAGTWLMSSYPRGSQFVKELQAPVSEGLQALEHAGLVEQRSVNSSETPALGATRLGETALAEGKVCRYLEP
jgi:hypothetical protein